ncbi:hypothetical protein ACFC1I_04055 [Microbacterium sp. NPDC056044]|uniref:hypothetical protein n=1 Tax=Microbacterium sp. NPDC056044 TaxID=3345690 RepID=UPI0035D7C637
MTPDLLDDLLDRSSPATRAADPADLRAMIGPASREARRPRRRRIGFAAGALAALLVGGAGVAAATDGFGAWTIEEPVGAVAFTMSNGFRCELRFSGYRNGPDPAFLSEVNRTLDEWYRTTDVVGEAQSLVPERQEEYLALRSPEERTELDRQLGELSPEDRAEAIAHNAFADEWIAWTLVVADLEAQALRDAGFSVPDPRFVGSDASSQIQCFEGDGRLYDFGAGS